MTIRIENISKYFDKFKALSDLSVTFPEGKITALLGPSGSGKTTLLRIIAGLENAEQGRIYFHQEDVTKKHVRDRRVGFVFQHYALFRHMTVEKNIAFGLEVQSAKQRPDKKTIREKVQTLLEMIQLPHLAKRYPSQLSGGQKQRVALARALAMNPKVLVLDEPFGALDPQVRKELRRWIRTLQEELGLTTILVTHDQEEALELADQIVVMSQGRIEQIDTPFNLYQQPANAFVMNFLGHVNTLSMTYNNLRYEQQQAWIKLPENKKSNHREIDFAFRPHQLTLSSQPCELAHLPLRVTSLNLIGSTAVAELKSEGWASKKPWEVHVSPDVLDKKTFCKGDLVYAIPNSGYVLGADSLKAESVIWTDAR